jgi:hypothetical protein
MGSGTSIGCLKRTGRRAPISASPNTDWGKGGTNPSQRPFLYYVALVASIRYVARGSVMSQLLTSPGKGSLVHASTALFLFQNRGTPAI